MFKKRIPPVFLIIILSVAFPIAASASDAVGFSDWASGMRLFSLSDGYPAVQEHDVSAAGGADAFSGIPLREFRPWTSQLRAAGFIRTESETLIMINSGYPLAFSLEHDFPFLMPEESAASEYLELSGGLTTGTLFVSESGLPSVHLYRDRFFDAVPDGSSGSRKAVVIGLEYKAGGDLQLNAADYPFAEENPDWEPVELISRDGRILIAWKYTDPKKTRFRYLVHTEDGRAVDEIDGSYFRDEYSMMDISSGPFALRGFERAAREGAAGSMFSASGDIYLMQTTVGPEPGNAPAAWFSASGRRAGREVPVQLPICADGSRWFILGEKEIYVCGRNISILSLPALPAGFAWTDIFVEGSALLLSWEEQRFPFTGRAGMILVEMRDILN